MHLRLSVHAEGPDLLAYRLDGLEHSRWPITPTDPLAKLERLGRTPAPAQAGAHLASLATLDAALDRQGYRRLTNWAPGPHGPACEVTTSTV